MNRPSVWGKVKISRGEGRERVRACRQTFGTVVPWHPLCIRSWCKLLFTRTLTVDRFDLHRLFCRHVARDLIKIIACKQVFWSLTWRLLVLNWWAFLAAMNVLASRSEGKSSRSLRTSHNLSLWNKWHPFISLPSPRNFFTLSPNRQPAHRLLYF